MKPRRLITVCSLLLMICLPLMGTHAQPHPGERQKYRRTLALLANLEVTLDFQDAPFEEVVRLLQTLSKIDMVIDPVIYQSLSPEALKVTLKVRRIKLISALHLILSYRKLGWLYRDGVILITTKKRSLGHPYRRVYDVRDLLFRIRHFPGPSISILPDEQENRGVRFETRSFDKSAFNDTDRLLALIKRHTGAGSWNNPNVSAALYRGLLVVVQTHHVQLEIQRLLLMLKAAK